MKVTVDTSTKALDALHARLSTVASGDTGRAIMREIAIELDAKVKANYSAGRDSYGVPWPPNVRPNRPGFRTGTLFGALAVRAYGDRILLSAGGVAYAGFFAHGHPRAKPRPIFPEASIGLPPSWKSTIERIVRKHVRRKVKG